MNITHTTIEVCVDCLTFIANGEVFDADGNDVADAHAERIEALWGSTHLTLDGDDEGGFSWHDCDGCGSNLGGDRFRASAWVEEGAAV